MMNKIIVAIVSMLVAVNLVSSAEIERIDADSSPVVRKRPTGWYMRTIVTASLPDGTKVIHRTAGVFGELRRSSPKRDSHDIPAMGKAILKVVFTHPEWEGDTEFYSDYTKYRGPKIRKRVWTFQIKNEKKINLANASIRIRIPEYRDVYAVKKDGHVIYVTKKSRNRRRLRLLRLVDLDTGKVYTYRKWRRLVLNMNGKHTRNFRWVLGRVSKSDKLLDRGRTIGAEVSKSDFSGADISGGKFGTPPE